MRTTKLNRRDFMPTAAMRAATTLALERHARRRERRRETRGSGRRRGPLIPVRD